MADFRTPSPEGVVNTPTIQILRGPPGLTIHFTGVLWSATEPTGPWSPVAGATSPHPVDPVLTTARFYRAGEPGAGGVFASRSVLEWTLTGPFQSHFDLAFAGTPDGIFPPVREKPYFPGAAQIVGLDIPVRLRVRGNSSLQECPFPKLKLKISSEDRPGTPFADAREIDIGTHCAEGGSGTVGRLRDERAAYREAIAYEIMEILGFTSPRVRRARITYQDTTTATDSSESPTGWQISRQAILLEDSEVVGERLGGRALDDAEIEALKDAHFNTQVITGLRLLHALLGNWDFVLSETGEELWNTEVIALADGSLIPMAGDFDLASMVTGRTLLNAPHDYRPDLPDLERETHFQVDEVRRHAKKPDFAAEKARYLQHRAGLEEWVRTAEVDEPGRVNLQKHLAAFFQALE